MDNPVTADHYPIWSLLFVTSIVQQNTEILSWYMKQDRLSFQPTEAYLRVQVCPKVGHKWRASHSLKSTLMSTSYEEYTLKQSCAEYTRHKMDDKWEAIYTHSLTSNTMYVTQVCVLATKQDTLKQLCAEELVRVYRGI